MGVANLEQRIDRRSASPRFHFDHAFFAGLGGQPEHVALGPAQRAVQRERRRRQWLCRLHGVVAVRKRAGPRLILGELRKRTNGEQLDVRNAVASDDPDRVDADGQIRGRLDQERRVATLLHGAALRRRGLIGRQQRERRRQRRANLRAFTEIPAGERQCEGLALLRSARLQFGDHRLG